MRTTRNNQPDIEKCLAGKCMGPFCPCLCHTSLKYDHAALVHGASRNGKSRANGGSVLRARPREAQVS